MLQFSKLISILSFLAIIYSIYGMRLEHEDVVFYIGTLVTSISVFILSIGILSMSVINKQASKKKSSDELKH